MSQISLDIPGGRKQMSVIRNIVFLASAIVMCLMAYREMSQLAVVATIY